MLKKIALAAALACIGSGAALAADQTYTELTPVMPSAPIAHNFSHVLETGSFFDTYNFTVGVSGVLSSSAVSINLSNLLGISGLVGTLWDNHHPFGSVALGIINGDNTTYNFNVAAGDYHIDFVGSLTGTAGGSYLASVSVAAVPEPESYAMFLAGLGIMGAIARRRSARA